MVGVPGRSKACNTCRLRKVACSLEKPECRTCIKASRICAGYQRERVFVLGPGTTYQAPKNSKPKSYINGDRELSIRRKKSADSIQKTESDDSEDTIQTTAIVKIRSPSPNSVYRQQILNEYIAYTLPSSWGTQHRGKNNGNWLVMLPTLPNVTAALESSILAVSTAKLGRLDDNEVLIRESLKFYVQGLWELQKALWDPKLMYKDETLAACMALIMYEVVECPDKSLDGWASHMKGCAAMFQLRGPNAYDTEFGHQLFLSFRVGEIQQAFAEHRRTYLADPEWLNLPFKNRPKSIFQRHLDLVAIVPNIIADGYERLQGVVEGTVVLDPTVVLLSTLDLINRCWKVDSQLQDFYKNLEEDTLGPIYWPELSIEIEDIDTEDELGKPFPVAFKFLDLGIAHLCLIHWSCIIILWTGMKYLYELLAGFSAANIIKKGAEPETGSPGFNINQLPPLEHRTDVATMAKNICQSVEYCLGEHHRGLGARAAIFPLKIAIEALHKVPGCELQVEWAKAAMARLVQTGVRIMNHLPISLTDPAFLTG